jgi:hypothetical protein
MRELLLQIACAGIWGIATAQAPKSTRWCPDPRPDEPLLDDARDLRNPKDSIWATRLYVFEIPRVPADAKITVLRDEGVCRAGAQAYAAHMRGIFGEGWPVKPVLVVRVGNLYLVDDQRSRNGKEAIWTALVLDNTLQTLVEYGGGS